MPMTTDDDEQAAHRRRALLDVVALGALLADPLAEAERVEQPDVGRHQDDHQGEREEQRPGSARRSSGIGRRVAELAPEAVDERGRARSRATP